MGCFRVDVTFFKAADRSRSAVVPQMLVGTGSEATWAPRKILEHLGVQPEKKDRAYVMANGQVITRTVGYAVLEVAPDFKTVDEVVFAERWGSGPAGCKEPRRAECAGRSREKTACCRGPNSRGQGDGGEQRDGIYTEQLTWQRNK